MDERDVIESGPSGPRRGLPTWLSLLAAAVVGVGAGAGLVHNLQQDSAGTPTVQESPPQSLSRHPGSPSTNPSGVAGQSPQTFEVEDGPLVGVTDDWELFARGHEFVVRLELARGRVTERRVPPVRSSGPVSFLVGPEYVLIDPTDLVPGFLVPDRGRVRQLPAPLAHGGMVVPGPQPGLVWRFEDTEGGTRMVLLALDGTRTGLSARVPGEHLWAVPDGAGFALVQSVGGVYQARPEGLRRITTGAVLAGGPVGWLVVECDDQGRCSRVVVDRSTLGRRVLGPARGHDIDGRVTAGEIAPDGSSAALIVGPGDAEPSRLHLVDLATGRVRAVEASLGRNISLDSLAWSPDSRWLFTVSSAGALLAVDPGTAAVHILDVAIPPVTQVAVRAASG